MDKRYICLVCGYNRLEELPYGIDGYPSYEICACCGFEYGYDDLDRGESFKEYREKWLNNGAQWFVPKERPAHWNLSEQLKNITKYESQ